MGEDERLREDCLTVLPVQAIAAFRKSDTSPLSLAVLGREEHIVSGVRNNHEWMSNDVDIQISDVRRRQNRVADVRWGRELKRRWAGVDADCPGAGFRLVLDRSLLLWLAATDSYRPAGARTGRRDDNVSRSVYVACR